MNFKVKVWFNSFIPKDVPGVTRVIPSGPYVGKTYLLGPPMPRAAWPPSGRGAFLSSNRTFSDSDTADPAHFKMHSEITVDCSTPSPTVTKRHVGGESIEIDPSDYSLVRKAYGSTLRMIFTPPVPSFGGGPGRAVKIGVKLSCAIPLIFGASIVADMDIIGMLTVDPAGGTVAYDGLVDEFPAYEAYASLNGGSPIILFRQPILPGKSPSSLVGMPTLRPLPGKVSLGTVFGGGKSGGGGAGGGW